MTETLCTSGSVKLAAGTNVSTSLTAANYTEFIEIAQGDLIADTRVDWVANWATLSGSAIAAKGACAAKAAIRAIKFDPSGYTTRSEANFIVNMNWAEYKDAVRILSDDKTITALGASLMS